jgi:hypothetical protein
LHRRLLARKTGQGRRMEKLEATTQPGVPGDSEGKQQGKVRRGLLTLEGKRGRPWIAVGSQCGWSALPISQTIVTLFSDIPIKHLLSARPHSRH